MKNKDARLIELARSQVGITKERPFLDHLIGWMAANYHREMGAAARSFLEYQNSEALAALDASEAAKEEPEDHAKEPRSLGHLSVELFFPEDFEGMIEDE